MDFLAILQTVQQVVQLVNLGLELGHDVVPQIKQLGRLFKGESLTDEERVENRALEAKLRAQLQEQLPPDDGTTST